MQALFKLSVEFRKEETKFLNRMEAQKGIRVGGTLGIVESDSQVGEAAGGGWCNQCRAGAGAPYWGC